MSVAPAASILTDNPLNGFQISSGDSRNLTGIISDLFDIFIVDITSVEPVCFLRIMLAGIVAD